jgi:hypothetical protein
MVFTSILVHGVTVPMAKVLMHGITLTRTLTQTGETSKRKPQAPVSIGDIHRIGVPIPLPTYNSTTGRRISTSASHTPRAVSPELAGTLRTSRSLIHDGEREAGLAPQPEGRTIA